MNNTSSNKVNYRSGQEFYDAIVSAKTSNKMKRCIQRCKDNAVTMAAFILAVQMGDVDIVALFIQSSKINLVQLETAVALAKSEKCSAIIEILEAKIKQIKLDQELKDIDRLHKKFACAGAWLRAGSLRLIHYIKNPRVNMNYIDENYGSPFVNSFEVAGDEPHKVVRAFLARPDLNVNLVNKDGKTALLTAIGNNDDYDVKELLAHKDIDVNFMCKSQNLFVRKYKWNYGDREYGHEWRFFKKINALGLAAANGNVKILRLLVNHPKIDLFAKFDGKMAIDLARENDHYTAIELLDIAMKKANKTNDASDTDLMRAVRTDDIELVKNILKNGKTDINQKNSKGQTALFMVQSKEVAEELIGHRADLSAKDNEGKPVFVSILERYLDSRDDRIASVIYLIEKYNFSIDVSGDWDPRGFLGFLNYLATHPRYGYSDLLQAINNAFKLSNCVGTDLIKVRRSWLGNFEGMEVDAEVFYNTRKQKLSQHVIPKKGERGCR